MKKAPAPRILIVTARGGSLGSGHLRRMQDLQTALSARSLSVELLNLSQDASLNISTRSTDFIASLAAGVVVASEELLKFLYKQVENCALVLLDLRDIDPRPFAEVRPVIALDNRNLNRPGSRILNSLRDPAGEESGGSLQYYDCLPHPAISLEDVLPNVLIDSMVRKFHAKDHHVQSYAAARQVMIYRGSLTLRNEWILEAVLQAAPRHMSIFWVGSGNSDIKAKPSNWTECANLSRDDFIKELSRSAVVLTYPGQTLLEAWYLGSRPVLLDVESEVHSILAFDLAKQSGLPYLQSNLDTDAHALAAWWQALFSKRVPQGPDGTGQDRLVALLESSLKNPFC